MRQVTWATTRDRRQLSGGARHQTRANNTPPPAGEAESPPSAGTLTPNSNASDSFTMANAMPQLTGGSLLQTTIDYTNMGQPIVQCVQVKQMNPAADGSDRWRVVMNDGVNFMQGMLSAGELQLPTTFTDHILTAVARNQLPRHPRTTGERSDCSSQLV